MANYIDCKAVAAHIKERCRDDVAALKAEGINPKLAIIRVGEKGPDIAYERGATAALNEIGVEVEVHALPEDVTTEQYNEEVLKVNADPLVHGILPFCPVKTVGDRQPDFNELLSAEKDVDSLTIKNMGKVLMGDPTALTPNTAQAVVELMDYYEIDPKSKDIVIINRSNVIGKPLAMMLTNRHATVSICHTATKDTASYTKKADIVVLGIPKEDVITADMINPGSIVIDASVNRRKVDDKWKTFGCYCEDVAEVAGQITPVPGLGGITSALLGQNVVKAARIQKETK